MALCHRKATSDMTTLLWIAAIILAYLIGHYNGEQQAMDEMDWTRED